MSGVKTLITQLSSAHKCAVTHIIATDVSD